MSASTDTYTTAEGDIVDRIAFRHYGHHRGTAEHIYAANAWLTRYPPRLPRGLVLTLPPLPQADPRASLVRLWD